MNRSMFKWYVDWAGFVQDERTIDGASSGVDVRFVKTNLPALLVLARACARARAGHPALARARAHARARGGVVMSDSEAESESG